MLIVDIIVSGLMMGSFYGLMAIGLTLIFGILKVVNFSHGEFFMVGAYAYTLLLLKANISVWIAVPSAFFLGTLVGLATERLLMRPLYRTYSEWGVMRDEYAIIQFTKVKQPLAEAAIVYPPSFATAKPVKP
ncbi:MAG TPA: branched-chain amino acid ABC transporter permease [Syntrophobacteria bacterium]|nr:branched-chain amino acid ABC transporter permease [Syntrophobacteria bacterium]